MVITKDKSANWRDAVFKELEHLLLIMILEHALVSMINESTFVLIFGLIRHVDMRKTRLTLLLKPLLVSIAIVL